MKPLLRSILISSGIAFCSSITAIPASGQISSDGTTNSNINQIDNIFEITGGAEAGSNLFHSFQEFSVPTGSEAFFNNADTIENIISRVTGGSISDIDGLIRANGNANLFLINPAGIVFGQNASLNIGGSFIGSTADSIIFPEGEFSAIDTPSPPLLTINMPIGLRLGDNPGTITNSSQASLNDAVNGFFLLGVPVPAGLQTSPGKTLALVGGEINFEQGNVSAPGGRIELGSVAGNSVVKIIPLEQGFTLGYEEVSGFQDIQLSESFIDTTDLTAFLDTTGLTISIGTSGAINLQGKQINLTNASAIFSINFGDESAGEINISASESIELIRDDANIFTIASIDGSGAAGNITINTNDLSLVDGGVILSSPTPTASSGDINITASNSVEVIGVETDGGGPTGISIQAFFQQATGGSGTNLTIETNKLILRDGAQIGSIVYGTSEGANVSITASDIEVVGEGELQVEPFFLGSAILSQAETGSIAKAGNLTIETERLITRDGGFISVSTFGEGESGELIINASDFINLSGTSITANLFRGSSGLFSLADTTSSGKGGNLRVSTPQLMIENGAKVSAETFGTGRAGDVNLSVARLIVKDGGQVTAGSLFAEDTSARPLGKGGTLTINATESVEIFGTGKIGETTVNSSLSTLAEGKGDAGDLNINTPILTLRNGSITAETNSSEGGNITLNIGDTLSFENSGEITATAGTAEAGGNGGDVTINADFILAFPTDNNYKITANAFEGDGGNIKLTTNSFFGSEFVDISASSQFGIDGDVTIDVLEIDPARGLTKLPANVIDASQQISQACTPKDEESGRFVATGRGGLPLSPNEPLRGTAVITNWVDEPTETTGRVTDGLAKNLVEDESISQIVEAQRWIINDRGNLELVAQPPTNPAMQINVNCDSY